MAALSKLFKTVKLYAAPRSDFAPLIDRGYTAGSGGKIVRRFAAHRLARRLKPVHGLNADSQWDVIFSDQISAKKALHQLQPKGSRPGRNGGYSIYEGDDFLAHVSARGNKIHIDFDP